MGIRINREFMEVIEHVHSRKFSPHLFETLFRKEDFIKLVTKYSSHLKSTEDVVLLSKHLSELQKAGKLDTQNAKVILDNLGK